MLSPCVLCVMKGNCPALTSCKINNSATASRRQIVCDENREIDSDAILKILDGE